MTRDYAPVIDTSDLGEVEKPAGIKTVFCIGNGESRKDFDLNTLRPHGKIYGCNAIYRDFTPDVLVAVDPGISHEIYHSGYCNKNEAWFRDWYRYDADLYNNMINCNLSLDKIESIKPYTSMNSRNDDTNKFVMHGYNVKQILEARKINKANANNKLGTKDLYISWIKNNDKSNNISDLPIKDKGWSTGATAGLIACNQNHYTITECYMIGHDLFSTTDKVNNIYKGTINYVKKDEDETPCINWISQWANLINGYFKVKFFKVNRTQDQSNKVDKKIKEFNVFNNFTYITYDELREKFKI